MKILYIAHRIPYPPNKGDKIRAFHEVQALAEKAEVYLCALVDDPEDWQHQAALRELCTHVSLVPLKPRLKKVLALRGLLTGKPMSVVYFHENKLQLAVDTLLAEHVFDAIVCFSGTSAEYIFQSKQAAKLFSTQGDRPRLIMDFCDVDSLKWKEYAQRTKFPLSLIYRTEGQLLTRYEKRVAQHFDNSILITEEERQLFTHHVFNTDKLTVIGNGVDTDYFKPAPNPKTPETTQNNSPELLFVGAMDYHANIDGVCWFAEAVWPSILEKYPEAVFTIVGRNPTQEVLALQKLRNIQVTGSVDDVRPYYSRATIVVVPLRIARGIQNKVLEAMAMGKPVIVSQQSFNGIMVRSERDCLVANTAENYIHYIFNLLEDKEMAEKIARNGRENIKDTYSWNDINLKLISLF